MSVEIDGAEKSQQIHGFGVSFNPESWNDSDLIPALDMLTDSMNFIICNIMVEMGNGFEEVNDNSDPFSMNWDYYNKLYETPKFQKIWNTLEHLNKHAVMYGLLIDFSGAVPEWMGKHELNPEYEDEFVEMELSFLMYAWHVRKVYFAYFTPLKLSDKQNEGLTIDTRQLTRVMRKLADRIDKAELRFSLIEPKMVVPDINSLQNGTNSFIPDILADSVIMSKVAHANLNHTGFSPGTEPNPVASYWQASLATCRSDHDSGKMRGHIFEYSSECVNNLLQLLKNGAYAVIWETSSPREQLNAPVPYGRGVYKC